MNNDNNENNKIRKKKVSTTDNNNTTQPKLKKKRKFIVLKTLSILFLILALAGSAFATAFVFTSLKDVEPVTKAALDKETNRTSEIRYATGETLAVVESSDQREPISITEMPEDIVNAIVAIEDERFYEHNGVDIMGLVRATVKTLTGDSQGGSTIPMQLSKMLLTTTEQTLARKVQDIYYAYEMDKNLTKNEILELYLNNFHVGRGLNGVEAGAQGYFSKSASELTLAESALLAGSTKYPNKYAAYVSSKLDGSEEIEDVENKLLFYINTEEDSLDDPKEIELEMIDKLWEWELIPTEDTYTQLKSGAMVVRKAIPNDVAIDRRDTVLHKMLELGYITQAEHDSAVDEKITINLPKSEDPVASSVEDFIEYEVFDALQQQGYTYDEASNMYYNGGLIINSTIDPTMQQVLEEEYEDNDNFPGTRDVDGVTQPQSSTVILDHQTSAIKAMIGGRNITVSKGTNRATDPVHPGSTIKPLTIYTPAIDTLKINQSTIVSDVEGGYKYDQNEEWDPNTTTAGKGSMTLRKGLAKSSNTIAVKTAEMLGETFDDSIYIMMDYLKNFGISTLHKDDYAFAGLTLGTMTYGISPLDMAAAYGALANAGVYTEPTVFTTITTFDNQLIAKSNPQSHKVVDEEVAFVITDMLTAVTESGGTGTSARLSGNWSMPVAGKTGTTNDTMEVWFAGYTPYYVAATYIADDVVVNGKNIDRRSVPGGSATAARLWSSIMTPIHENLNVTDFEAPEGVYFTSINVDSGNKMSGGAYSAFIDGTYP